MSTLQLIAPTDVFAHPCIDDMLGRAYAVSLGPPQSKYIKLLQHSLAPPSSSMSGHREINKHHLHLFTCRGSTVLIILSRVSE